MGLRSRIAFYWLTLLIGTSLAVQAQAADLYWFADGTNLGGTGTWSAAGMTWSTTTPAPTLTVWNPASTAIFRGTAGTVTVANPNIDAATGMRFQTNLYSLAGGSVTLTGASSAANFIDVDTGLIATSNAPIAGSAGLTKVGGGIFVLAATNTNSGETVVEGGLLSLTGSLAPSANAYIGYANPGTTFAISGGGTATHTSSYLGTLASASANVATIAGMGSKWTNAADLVIGYGSSINALTAHGKGAVATVNGFVGYGSGAADNAVLVSGAGSQWTNSNVLYVGFDGDGNSFTVEDGGSAVSTKDTVVGFNTASANNTLTVRDADSQFEVSSPNTLIIGDNGDASTLAISNGGTVKGHNARLARSADSSNNIVTVSGSGSNWTNTGTIRVGAAGPGNSVTVSAGGAVSFVGNAFLGFALAAANSTVTVTGTGSTWSSGNLTVGLASTGNVFTVSAGGAVTSPGILLADDPGSEGTFNIGSGGLPGTVDGPIAIGDGSGIVNFNHSAAAYDFDDPISGAGAVRFIGSGTTTMSATSTYSGGTTLSAGTVRLGVNNALPSSGTFTLNGGTLDANGKSAVLGPLSVEATSTLRFAPGGGQTLAFSSAAYVGGTLTIVGWNGFSGNHLLISADPQTSGILDHIQFSGYPAGAIWRAGEVFPPPSRVSAAPALSLANTLLASLLLCAIGFFAMRRRAWPLPENTPG